jgi:hypothetical protein
VVETWPVLAVHGRNGVSKRIAGRRSWCSHVSECFDSTSMVLAKQSGMYIRRLLRFFCRVRLGTANCLPSRFLTYLVGQALEMPRWWSCLAFQETQAPGTSPDNTALVATVFLLAAASTWQVLTETYLGIRARRQSLSYATECGSLLPIWEIRRDSARPFAFYFASEEHERMTRLLHPHEQGTRIDIKSIYSIGPVDLDRSFCFSASFIMIHSKAALSRYSTPQVTISQSSRAL